jgi:class 3 adenylate cyclase
LVRGETILPKMFQSVTVQVSDIGDFSDITQGFSPAETVDILNKLYEVIDGTIETSDVCRIGSFSDAIMVWEIRTNLKPGNESRFYSVF